jgi:hypothetical protein
MAPGRLVVTSVVQEGVEAELALVGLVAHRCPSLGAVPEWQSGFF